MHIVISCIMSMTISVTKPLNFIGFSDSFRNFLIKTNIWSFVNFWIRKQHELALYVLGESIGRPNIHAIFLLTSPTFPCRFGANYPNIVQTERNIKNMLYCYIKYFIKSVGNARKLNYIIDWAIFVTCLSFSQEISDQKVDLKHLCLEMLELLFLIFMFPFDKEWWEWKRKMMFPILHSTFFTGFRHDKENNLQMFHHVLET